MNKEAKAIILYHRSYRKVAGSVASFFLLFFVMALPLSFIVAFFFSPMSHAVSAIAHYVLVPLFPPDTVRITQVPFLNSSVFLVDLPGSHPSVLFSVVNALICLLLLVVLPARQHAKHVFIFLIVICFINLVSSVYFAFFSHRFPYEVVDYSELYIKQQIGIWFFVPVIIGISILPLPSTLRSKAATLVGAFCYSLVFGTVRYAVFLFVLAKASLLYMAVLFFVMGPLIDFIYIVGIYSLHVTRLAKKMRSDFASWKWLY
jgi:hypothetical protein